MTIFRDWYIFLGAVGLLASSGLCFGDYAFEYSLSPQTIRPGERARLRLQLSKIQDTTPVTQQPHSVESAIVRDELFSDSKKFTLLETNRHDDTNISVWTYDLTAYLPGKIPLPPIEVAIGPHNFSTERINLRIASSQTQEDLRLHPAFGAVELP